MHSAPLEALIQLYHPNTASQETAQRTLPEPDELIDTLRQAERAHPIGFALFELRYLGYSAASYQRLLTLCRDYLRKGENMKQARQYAEQELINFCQEIRTERQGRKKQGLDY
ncbi:hypothetical protein BOO24_16800 [Vibrio navarrensis]|uniref:hypothetical protein n=1 Tax=Vibrio navarrensis TaxID=29495 RepID=UPI001869E3CE|nr:hypothetical protein [Vibrio navarrensis]MBE4593994.1 hypothetical protein [Vibrio navarrensis]